MGRITTPIINRLGRTGDRHALAIGIGALLVALAIAAVVIQSTNSVPFTDPYRASAIVPSDAPILRPGNDVRVAGRRRGQVREVEAVRDGRRVIFDLEGRLGRGATASVRQRGFSGSVYLFLTRGDERNPMPEGDTIPRSRTSTAGELSAIASAFDGETRRAMASTLRGFGGGLAGRGDDLNSAVRELPATARDLRPVLDGLAADGQLSDMLADLRRTATGFAAPGVRELRPFLRSANGTLGVLAAERESVGRLIGDLTPFEDQALRTLPVADPLLASSTALSRRLTGAMAQLRVGLPAVNGLLARADDVGELTTLARELSPVAVRGRPLLGELTPVGRSLGPLAEPLARFAATIDPYREDIIRGMTVFQGFTSFYYPGGLASGAGAVRFMPIFTCARPRNPYAAPGQAFRDRTRSLAEACAR